MEFTKLFGSSRWQAFWHEKNLQTPGHCSIIIVISLAQFYWQHVTLIKDSLGSILEILVSQFNYLTRDYILFLKKILIVYAFHL